MDIYKLAIVIILINGLQGENFEADDERVNILLAEMEEHKADNAKILQHLSALKADVQRIENKIIMNSANQRKQESELTKPAVKNTNGNVEQTLGTIDKRIKKIESFLSETMNRNKEIYEKLDSTSREKGTGNNLKSDVTGLPNEIKKELSERISGEFVQMKNWLEGTVKRLAESEMKCSALIKDITSYKEQCTDKLKEKIQNQDGQDFQDEVRKNLSRVERSVEEKMEKLAQEMEQRLRISGGPGQVQEQSAPKPTEFILPTLPTTVMPKIPVSIPCNNKVLIKKPQDCAELKQKGGVTCDGTYIIYPKKKKAVIAFCDMNTLGGGWTVTLKRGKTNNKLTNFDLLWRAYKKGFGKTQQEFWIGNENLHLLTSFSNDNHSQELLLQLEFSTREEFSLLFNYMYIENEENNYKIHIGNVSGNYHDLAQPFAILNNRIFRTRDMNDGIENCAERHRGGWWFSESCDEVTSVLTAPYYSEADFKEPWQGMLWPSWKGDLLITSVQMKIRTKEKHDSP